MRSSDEVRPDTGAGFDSFDDDAIRIELRRIVKNEEFRLLEKLAASENDVRAECEMSDDVDEDAKRRVHSKIETAKSDARRAYQMILDFIDRR